jgi:ATP-dependent DNA helicase RecG
MYKTYVISKEQAEKIINVKEDYLNDVKAKEIRPAKLSETVSAFANAAGGDIYIGVTEDINNNKVRGWDGFDDVEEANNIIHVLIEAHPLANHLKFEFLACDEFNGLVLHVSISKVKDIVKASNDEIYVRANAGKIKINTIINFVLNVIPSSEPITYLKNQDLVRDNNVKAAGVLLFCDEPAVYLPKRSSIKLLRYTTKEETVGREFLEGPPITIEGDLYNLIYGAVDATKKKVEEIKKLGERGLEAISYPHETLHEIITNAVLHRDYSIAVDTQIRVYDNRIEIESPGRLPGHVTVDNILDTQSARNPKIVRLINKFPDAPNQDVGEGLNTAFEAMRNLRLKEPHIIETENSLVVKILHESLASPEQIVMEFLESHDAINNTTARDLTGIKSENTMKNVFLRLKDRGMLEPIPGLKGSKSAWRKPQ